MSVPTANRYFFWLKVVEIYEQVFSVLRKNPTILFLFLVIGMFDLIALVLLFLAPSPPVSYVLAPVIRTFWSDRFLHYPENFLLLPKLFQHAHFLINTVIGVFISGVVIKKIEAEAGGEKSSILSAAVSTIERYLSLVIAWLVSYGVFILALKVMMPVLPRHVLVQLAAGFALGITFQAVLAFVLPALLIVKKRSVQAIWEGIQFGVRNIALTSALIAVPMFLALAVSFVKVYAAPLFIRVHPEIVLWVLAGGILISLAADILITSSVTLFFLKARHDRS